MKTIIKFSALTTILLSLQACMTPIGKEDFTCPNQKKGGVCAGPREIHDLTNTRTNLEDLKNEGIYDGYVVGTDEDGKTIATKRDKTPSAKSPNMIVRGMSDPDPAPVAYEPRDHTQHSVENYQPAKAIPQVRGAQAKDDEFSSWPNATEPLAPEPLAVLEAPKIMRVLVASYKDARGNLNMPGYVYVQVEAETWSIGEAANLRPQRVIPKMIKEKTEVEKQNQELRKKGVSPIETTSGNGG